MKSRLEENSARQHHGIKMLPWTSAAVTSSNMVVAEGNHMPITANYGMSSTVVTIECDV